MNRKQNQNQNNKCKHHRQRYTSETINGQVMKLHVCIGVGLAQANRYDETCTMEQSKNNFSFVTIRIYSNIVVYFYENAHGIRLGFGLNST